jgi:hypothetical protein
MVFIHVCVTIYYLEIVPATSVFRCIAVGLIYEPRVHHRYVRNISPFSAFLLLLLSFHIPNLKHMKPIISFDLQFIS